MTTLRPNNLKVLNFHIEAAALQFTDLVLGKMPNDAKIFYIDVVAHDAGEASSFTGGTILLEYASTQTGTQTAIDTITVADDTELTEVGNADLTNDVVPGGSWLFYTGATLANVSDHLEIQIAYVDLQEN